LRRYAEEIAVAGVASTMSPAAVGSHPDIVSEVRIERMFPYRDPVSKQIMTVVTFTVEMGLAHKAGEAHHVEAALKAFAAVGNAARAGGTLLPLSAKCGGPGTSKDNKAISIGALVDLRAKVGCATGHGGEGCRHFCPTQWRRHDMSAHLGAAVVESAGYSGGNAGTSRSAAAVGGAANNKLSTALSMSEEHDATHQKTRRDREIHHHKFVGPSSAVRNLAHKLDKCTIHCRATAKLAMIECNEWIDADKPPLDHEHASDQIKEHQTYPTTSLAQCNARLKEMHANCRDDDGVSKVAASSIQARCSEKSGRRSYTPKMDHTDDTGCEVCGIYHYMRNHGAAGGVNHFQTRYVRDESIDESFSRLHGGDEALERKAPSAEQIESAVEMAAEMHSELTANGVDVSKDHLTRLARYAAINGDDAVRKAKIHASSLGARQGASAHDDLLNEPTPLGLITVYHTPGGMPLRDVMSSQFSACVAPASCHPACALAVNKAVAACMNWADQPGALSVQSHAHTSIPEHLIAGRDDCRAKLTSSGATCDGFSGEREACHAPLAKSFEHFLVAAGATSSSTEEEEETQVEQEHAPVESIMSHAAQVAAVANGAMTVSSTEALSLLGAGSSSDLGEGAGAVALQHDFCGPEGITNEMMYDYCYMSDETAKLKVNGWTGYVECAIPGFVVPIRFLSDGALTVECDTFDPETRDTLVYKIGLKAHITADELQSKIAATNPSIVHSECVVMNKPVPSGSDDGKSNTVRTAKDIGLLVASCPNNGLLRGFSAQQCEAEYEYRTKSHCSYPSSDLVDHDSCNTTTSNAEHSLDKSFGSLNANDLLSTCQEFGDNYAIQSWQFKTKNAISSAGQVEVKCCKLNTPGVKKTVAGVCRYAGDIGRGEKRTTYSNIRDPSFFVGAGAIFQEFEDDNVCADGSVLSTWKMEKCNVDYQSGLGVKVTTTCASLTDHSVAAADAASKAAAVVSNNNDGPSLYVGACKPGGAVEQWYDNQIDFLMRHTPSCPKPGAMRGWQFQACSKLGNLLRIFAPCVYNPAAITRNAKVVHKATPYSSSSQDLFKFGEVTKNRALQCDDGFAMLSWRYTHRTSNAQQNLFEYDRVELQGNPSGSDGTWDTYSLSTFRLLYTKDAKLKSIIGAKPMCRDGDALTGWSYRTVGDSSSEEGFIIEYNCVRLSPTRDDFSTPVTLAYSSCNDPTLTAASAFDRYGVQCPEGSAMKSLKFTKCQDTSATYISNPEYMFVAECTQEVNIGACKEDTSDDEIGLKFLTDAKARQSFSTIFDEQKKLECSTDDTLGEHVLLQGFNFIWSNKKLTSSYGLRYLKPRCCSFEMKPDTPPTWQYRTTSKMSSMLDLEKFKDDLKCDSDKDIIMTMQFSRETGDNECGEKATRGVYCVKLLCGRPLWSKPEISAMHFTDASTYQSKVVNALSFKNSVFLGTASLDLTIRGGAVPKKGKRFFTDYRAVKVDGVLRGANIRRSDANVVENDTSVGVPSFFPEGTEVSYTGIEIAFKGGSAQFRGTHYAPQIMHTHLSFTAVKRGGGSSAAGGGGGGAHYFKSQFLDVPWPFLDRKGLPRPAGMAANDTWSIIGGEADGEGAVCAKKHAATASVSLGNTGIDEARDATSTAGLGYKTNYNTYVNRRDGANNFKLKWMHLYDWNGHDNSLMSGFSYKSISKGKPYTGEYHLTFGEGWGNLHNKHYHQTNEYGWSVWKMGKHHVNMDCGFGRAITKFKHREDYRLEFFCADIPNWSLQKAKVFYSESSSQTFKLNTDGRCMEFTSPCRNGDGNSEYLDRFPVTCRRSEFHLGVLRSVKAENNCNGGWKNFQYRYRCCEAGVTSSDYRRPPPPRSPPPPTRPPPFNPREQMYQSPGGMWYGDGSIDHQFTNDADDASQLEWLMFADAADGIPAPTAALGGISGMNRLTSDGESRSELTWQADQNKAVYAAVGGCDSTKFGVYDKAFALSIDKEGFALALRGVPGTAASCAHGGIVSMTGEFTLARGVLDMGVAGKSSPVPVADSKFVAHAEVSLGTDECAGFVNDNVPSPVTVTGVMRQIQMRDGFLVHDAVVVLMLTRDPEHDELWSIAATLDGSVDFTEVTSRLPPIPGGAFIHATFEVEPETFPGHAGSFSGNMKTQMATRGVVRMTLGGEGVEDVDRSAVLEIELSDMNMPCGRSDPNPFAVGTLKANAGMAAVQAEVQVVLTCGDVGEVSDTNPRITATSSVKLKPVWSQDVNNPVNDVMDGLSEVLSLPPVDVEFSAYWGETGWYWNLISKISHEVKVGDSTFDVSLSVDLNTRFGLPVWAGLDLESNFDSPLIKFNSKGSFQMGPQCIEPGWALFGNVSFTPRDHDPKTVLNSIIGAYVEIIRSCPDENQMVTIYLNAGVDYFVILDPSNEQLTKAGVADEDPYMWMTDVALNITVVQDEEQNFVKAAGMISGNFFYNANLLKDRFGIDLGLDVETCGEIRFSFEHEGEFKVGFFIESLIAVDNKWMALTANFTIAWPCETGKKLAGGGHIQRLNISDQFELNFEVGMYFAYYCGDVIDTPSPKYTIGFQMDSHKSDEEVVQVAGVHVRNLYLFADVFKVSINGTDLTDFEVKGMLGGEVVVSVAADKPQISLGRTAVPSAESRMRKLLEDEDAVKGTVSGKLAYTFDTRDGSFDIVAGFQYEVPPLYFSLEAGSSSECRETGSFAQGTLRYTPENAESKDTLTEFSGDVKGTVWCGDHARNISRLNVDLTLSILTMNVSGVTVGLENVTINVMGLIPKNDDELYFEPKDRSLDGLDWFIVIRALVTVGVLDAFTANKPGTLDINTYIDADIALTKSTDYDMNITRLETRTKIVGEIPGEADPEDPENNSPIFFLEGEVLTYFPCKLNEQTKKYELFVGDVTAFMNLPAIKVPEGATSELYASIRMECWDPEVEATSATNSTNFTNSTSARLGDDVPKKEEKLSMPPLFISVDAPRLDINMSAIAELLFKKESKETGSLGQLGEEEAEADDALMFSIIGARADVELSIIEGKWLAKGSLRGTFIYSDADEDENSEFKIVGDVKFDTIDHNYEVVLDVYYTHLDESVGKESNIHVHGQIQFGNNCTMPTLLSAEGTFESLGVTITGAPDAEEGAHLGAAPSRAFEMKGFISCPAADGSREYTMVGQAGEFSLFDGAFWGESFLLNVTMIHYTTGKFDFYGEIDFVNIGFSVMDVPSLPGGLEAEASLFAIVSNMDRPKMEMVRAEGKISALVLFGSRTPPEGESKPRFLEIAGFLKFAYPCNHGDSFAAGLQIGFGFGDVFVDSVGAEVAYFCHARYTERVLHIKASVKSIVFGDVALDSAELELDVFDDNEPTPPPPPPFRLNTSNIKTAEISGDKCFKSYQRGSRDLVERDFGDMGLSACPGGGVLGGFKMTPCLTQRFLMSKMNSRCVNASVLFNVSTTSQEVSVHRTEAGPIFVQTLQMFYLYNHVAEIVQHWFYRIYFKIIALTYAQHLSNYCQVIASNKMSVFKDVELKCEAGYAMQSWKFHASSNGAYGYNFEKCLTPGKFKYTCRKLDEGNLTASGFKGWSTYNATSKCRPIKGLDLKSLSEHEVKCNAGDLLQSWKITDEGCASEDAAAASMGGSVETHMRIAYTCTKPVVPPVPKISPPPKENKYNYRGSVSGAASVSSSDADGFSGSASISIMFDTRTGHIAVASSLEISTENFYALVHGAWANFCRDVGDYASGTIGLTSGPGGFALNGTFTGQRYCKPVAENRYEFTVDVPSVAIDDTVKSSASATVNVQGKSREIGKTDVVHDDDLDWYAQGVVKVEEFASPPSSAFKIKDVSVAFDITVLRWHEGFKFNVLEFSGSLYFKIGKDDATPFFELTADVQYRHPCRRGDKMDVKNVEMNLNIKPLSVSDLTGSAVLYCNPKQDELAYELEASMDKLALGSIVIADVKFEAGAFFVCAIVKRTYPN
jgi:hypothetical protein